MSLCGKRVVNVLRASKDIHHCIAIYPIEAFVFIVSGMLDIYKKCIQSHLYDSCIWT